MTFRKYLQDRYLICLAWLAFVMFTGFMLWLLPELALKWTDYLYIVLIQLLVLLVFLGLDYLRKRNWWQKLSAGSDTYLEQYLNGAKNNEEHLVQEYVNNQVKEHQRVLQQLIQNSQDQKDYIDSWIHEIKVPLAALDLIINAIEYDIADEKYVLLKNEWSKIDDYVDQVLYYARLDNFSNDYLIQEYSLKEILQPAIRSQTNYFIQKRLQLDIQGEDQHILTDGKWVSFIFRQLLSNAIKYTPENGQILITITRNGSGVSLALKDSGIGIPPEDLSRIFDKGYTGENGRFSNQHSTGLGLYLAKNLAKKLGAELTVESVVDSGTTMTLFFPFLSYYGEQR